MPFRFPNRRAIRNLLQHPDCRPPKAIRRAAAASHTADFDGVD